MPEIDPLLAAVEALTKPQTRGIAEKDAAGRWKRVREVRLDPLLQQIHDRVWPSGESNGGALTLPNERLPLDSTALYEYSKIAGQINSWVIMVRLVPTRNPITDLQRWYGAVRLLRDWDDVWALRALRGWEEHITKLLSKTGQFVVERPCPICGTTTWGERIHGGGMWPIKVEYVLDENDHMTDETALCQVCRTIWPDHGAIMELAEELNEKGA
jgi:hypothetical protein